jgi:hypothetical protein
MGPKINLQSAPHYEEFSIANVRVASENFIHNIPEYPSSYSGRGTVICGGGKKYFTNAWIAINMLLYLKSDLPIQLWYLGAKEMDDHMIGLAESLGAECVNAQKIRELYPARILNGWELKPYAIIHSPFKEVLFLDADNVPVVKPDFLFETPEFQETGAIFWPDFNRLGPEREIWEICGVPYADEPEFETGQIVIDKEKCWKELCLTMWYNEYSDFYYQYVHGDKETFHMAFRKMNKCFSMVPTSVYSLTGTMCQHDFNGNRIFQHRNVDKWDLDRGNYLIYDFWYEEKCLQFLEMLRILWDGKIRRDTPYRRFRTREERMAFEELTTRVYEYFRVGYDSRFMSFLPDGAIGQGAAGCEVYWKLLYKEGNLFLEIASENEPTCYLRRTESGVWEGRWLQYEKMPLKLIPGQNIEN